MKEEILLYNITIYQGEEYRLDISAFNDNDEPLSFTGWTVEATLREFAESSDGIDFLAISNASGISIRLSNKQTEEIGYCHGEYDIFVTDLENNIRVKLLSGQAEIIPDSTR